MAVTANHLKQVFSRDLQSLLFPDNSYVRQSKNDSAFIEGSQVNIPQVTASVAVKEIANYGKDDRASSSRSDGSIAYGVKQIKTQATFLQSSEDLVVNYSKRMSLVEQHADELMEYAGAFVQHEWASNSDSKVIRSSGSARSATYGAGHRKAIKFDDLLKVRKVFREQDVPIDNLCALISPEMEMDLLKLSEVTNMDYKGVNGRGVLRVGEVDRFLRIDFFVRSKVNVFNNSSNPGLKSLGSTIANTDHAGAIFWDKRCVSVAMGGVKTMYEAEQPTIGGDEISSILRLGALYRRKDGKGVVHLVEAAA